MSPPLSPSTLYSSASTHAHRYQLRKQDTRSGGRSRICSYCRRCLAHRLAHPCTSYHRQADGCTIGHRFWSWVACRHRGWNRWQKTLPLPLL